MENTIKRVTVYQMPTEEMRDALSDFADVSEMEAVGTFEYASLFTDVSIMEHLYYRLINEDEAMCCLNYCFGTGDIMQVDDKFYRCVLSDWELL